MRGRAGFNCVEITAFEISSGREGAANKHPHHFRNSPEKVAPGWGRERFEAAMVEI